MTCFAPLSAWYAKDINPETGKRSLVFHPSKAYVDMPVEIPCGKCHGCRADQSLMWSIRAYHEGLQHDRKCFITLTYDDRFIPADGRISKRDLQLFFKRLRKEVSPVRLRYIACGEYGDLTRRPHYHAVLFGIDFNDVRRVMVGNTAYTHSTLERVWNQGNVVVEPCTFASICYTCGYVMKKAHDADTFNLMSRRPGIGKDWLDKHSDELRRTGKVVIEGREFPVPPRYLRWNEEEFEQLKLARAKYAKEQSKKHDPVSRRRRLDARKVNRKALTQQRSEKL